MTYPFKNLVFEGGGVRGIAYYGVLKVLEEKDLLKHCQRFAGTSAGSINAWLCAYFKDDISRIEDIQRKTNFADFADDDKGIIRDSYRLINKYGWHKGDNFYSWAQKITKEKFKKEHITFKELYDQTGNDLVVVACNASKGKSVKFSKDTTPDFFVERAVRISMSIPVYFRGIFIPDKSVDNNGNILGNPGIDKEVDKGRDIFVDGGVLDNYPIQTFDLSPYIGNPLDGEVIENFTGRTPPSYNKSTLGFRVDSQTELNIGNLKVDTDQFKAENFFKYLLGLADLLHQTSNKRHLDAYDWHRTVRINTLDFRSTDFNLSKDDQDLLIQKGEDATHEYLASYDSSWLNYVAI